MTDMTYGIGGCASIASAVCCAHVGDVDMADDIIVNGHILAYDEPAIISKRFLESNAPKSLKILVKNAEKGLLVSVSHLWDPSATSKFVGRNVLFVHQTIL